MSDTTWNDEEWERQQAENEAVIKALSDTLRPCVRHGNAAHIDNSDFENVHIIADECGCYLTLEYFNSLDEAVTRWNDQPQVDRLLAQLAAQRTPPAAPPAVWRPVAEGVHYRGPSGHMEHPVDEVSVWWLPDNSLLGIGNNRTDKWETTTLPPTLRLCELVAPGGEAQPLPQPCEPDDLPDALTLAKAIWDAFQDDRVKQGCPRNEWDSQRDHRQDDQIEMAKLILARLRRRSGAQRAPQETQEGEA